MSRQLVLEMTPTCVNKTAIYHIAMDTYAALTEFQLRTSYCGALRSMPQNDEERRSIAQEFFSYVGSWASGSAHDDELRLVSRPREDKTPMIFFDPIYTLFHEILETDVVFVLDLSTLTNPSWHSPVVTKCYERAFRKLLGSRARVLSISHHCTAILRANFSIPASEITTVPLYLRKLPKQPPKDCPWDLRSKHFFLFVGSMEMRKNLVGLIHAFALSGLYEQGWKLALAGGNGLGWEEIHEAAGLFDGVELLGFVSDEELSWLYANAAAFAYPSYLEGFGLPLLEAMAYGLPCLASVTGASREVCGCLGILVDPYHMKSVVQGLVDCAALVQSNNGTFAAQLKARASDYSFDEYLNVLRQVLPH